MDPNHGTEVAALRVRLVRTGREPWSWSIAHALQATWAGPGWQVVISSADSPEVLAQRSFGRRHEAQQARDEFARLAAAGLVDASDREEVERAIANL